MTFPIQADMSLIDRCQLFEKYLDDKYERTDKFDDRARLKAERAQMLGCKLRA